MPTRAEALALLSDWNVNPSLRKHGLLVEAGVGGYAIDDGLDNATVEMWGIAGLLHDLDYERFPDPPRMVRSAPMSCSSSVIPTRSFTPSGHTTTPWEFRVKAASTTWSTPAMSWPASS